MDKPSLDSKQSAVNADSYRNSCPNCSDFESKNHIVAGLLALLVGGLGVHKFYLGRIGLGLIYLIFCWTGIPSIIGFVEGIIYLCQSQSKFARKYSGRSES